MNESARKGPRAPGRAGRLGEGDTLPIGPMVAALGALLLIVSLFLDWYEGGLEGFAVFEFLDLLLLLLALATIASLAGGLGLIKPAPAPILSLAVAVLAIFVVASQVLNDPPAVAGDAGPGRDVGIWLALAGSALMLAGSVLAFARISLAVETRPGGSADRSSAGRPQANTVEDTDERAPTRPLTDPDGPGAGRGPERP